MKIELDRSALLDRLGLAVRGVSPRSAIQALSGILLAADEDRLELRATDMELAIRVGMSASIETPGVVVLPGRLLLDVVRSMSAPSLSIEHHASDGAVELVADTARFQLRTLPADDFPKLPDSRDAVGLKVPAAAFVETASRVARSASRDETRPHLTGVLVSASDRQLRMVATDSYRLSVKETRLESALEGSLEVNVPARTLQELSRISGVVGVDEITVLALDNQVAFVLGEAWLFSRLVEGRFPNYQGLLPEAYEHELRINGAELVEVVRRISLLAQKNSPLRLRFADGAVEISAQTPDVGEAKESLPVPFEGEPLEIGFNAEFFREGLESAESEELQLKLISPLRPGLIESAADGGDGSFLYLVMPIRLNV